MTKRSLLAVAILLWSFGANTQLFNPVATAPFTGVFGPPGTLPTPFFNETPTVNYNYGGQGVGYKVPSPTCVGVTCVAGATTYRADAVNFKATTFSGFTFLLAFNASPNSYNYTISISQPGPYVITLWGGSGSTGGSWNILIDNQVVGNVPTPFDPVHGYNTMAPATSAAFNATLGTHILTLAWGSGDVNGSPGDIVAWQGGVASTTGVACDIGPPYTGQIPAAATQAGLTHCGANYDFTYTGSFTDSLGTHTWSTLSSWLSCGGFGGNTILTFTGATPCDTGHQNITTDGGTQVLALTYTLADKNNGIYYNVVQSGGFVGSSIAGTSFPIGHYYELVVKLSNFDPCGTNNCIVYDTSTYAPDAFSGGNPCFIETDSELWDNSNPNVGVDYWNPTCGTSGNAFGPAVNTPPIQQPSTSAYTTYGILSTIDNVNNNFGACTYSATGAVSGLPASSWKDCATQAVGGSSATNAVFNSRNGVFLVEGPQSSGQGGVNWSATTETTTIQRVTFWVCPNPTGGAWQTGQCYNNPVITAHP
jgi:hypothetical protein